MPVRRNSPNRSQPDTQSKATSRPDTTPEAASQSGVEPGQLAQAFATNPQKLQPQHLLTLQHTIGNRAVQRQLIQRRPAGPLQDPGGNVPADTEAAIEHARGDGQPLGLPLANQMGTALGHDFGKVQLHTDQQADTLNRSLSARAFTTGHDIFFRQGEYQPATQAGQALIAHELVHVAQQQTVGQNSSSVQRLPTKTEGELWHDPDLPGDPQLELLKEDRERGQLFRVKATGKEFWYNAQDKGYASDSGEPLADPAELTLPQRTETSEISSKTEEKSGPSVNGHGQWKIFAKVAAGDMKRGTPVLKKDVTVEIVRISGSSPNLYVVDYNHQAYCVDRSAIKTFWVIGDNENYLLEHDHLETDLEKIVLQIESLPLKDIKKHYHAIYNLLMTLIAPQAGSLYLKIRHAQIPKAVNNSKYYQEAVTNCAKTSLGALTGTNALTVEKNCTELILGKKLEEAEQETLVKLQMIASSPVNMLDHFCMLTLRNLDIPLEDIINPVTNIHAIKNPTHKQIVLDGFFGKKGIYSAQISGVKLYALHAMKQAGVELERVEEAELCPIAKGKQMMQSFPSGTQYVVGVIGHKEEAHWLYAANHNGRVLFYDYQQDRLYKLILAFKDLEREEAEESSPSIHDTATVPTYGSKAVEEKEGASILFIAFVPKLNLVDRMKAKLRMDK